MKEYQPPEYNEAVMCPDCGERSDVLSGYGLIGGGTGPYTMCSNCGMIVTKSFDEGNKEPEIIDGEFSDAQRPAISEDKATDDNK
jgi:hypothetical protein